MLLIWITVFPVLGSRERRIGFKREGKGPVPRKGKWETTGRDREKDGKRFRHQNTGWISIRPSGRKKYPPAIVRVRLTFFSFYDKMKEAGFQRQWLAGGSRLAKRSLLAIREKRAARGGGKRQESFTNFYPTSIEWFYFPETARHRTLKKYCGGSWKGGIV